MLRILSSHHRNKFLPNASNEAHEMKTAMMVKMKKTKIGNMYCVIIPWKLWCERDFEDIFELEVKEGRKEAIHSDGVVLVRFVTTAVRELEEYGGGDEFDDVVSYDLSVFTSISWLGIQAHFYVGMHSSCTFVSCSCSSTSSEMSKIPLPNTNFYCASDCKIWNRFFFIYFRWYNLKHPILQS